MHPILATSFEWNIRDTQQERKGQRSREKSQESLKLVLVFRPLPIEDQRIPDFLAHQLIGLADLQYLM